MSSQPTRAIDLGTAPAFQSLLEEAAVAVRAGSPLDGGVWERAILEPARSVLTRAGKGIRGQLVEHAWALAGGAPGVVPDCLPLCLELIHAGSLIVDDIEDDSLRRRGAPALHRSHGVPVALNTGNWLYFLATDLVTDAPFTADVRLSLLQELARSLRRCHEGQALDLSVQVGSIRKGDVRDLVETATRLKTGTLMSLAARMGALGAGAGGDTLEAIGRFGAELGVGLQMLDDLSGIVSPSRRDKGLEDLRLGRPTWPWVWLAESSDDVTFQDAARQARELSLDWQAGRLLERIAHSVDSVGRAAIHAQLDRGLEDLEAALGPTPALERLSADVRGIVGAYV